MNLALLNTSAAFKYYRDKGKNVAVEIVAYGPGAQHVSARIPRR
jgi:hypothetical protein